jgi:hypothetical protein
MNRMSTTAALVIALAAGVCWVDEGAATEVGTVGNYLPGGTMGATLGAAPPPGLYVTNTMFYAPMASGNGNTNCGDGCRVRYNFVGDSMTFSWGSGLTFLGATYAPSIQLTGLQGAFTPTPYPPGGGVGESPVYGITMGHAIANTYVNPLNLSWNLGNALFVSAGLGFVAPTGTTYAGSVVPDWWTFRPRAAVSYLGNGWNLTASAVYDVNTASQGRTGLYQVFARSPATAAPLAAFLGGPGSPGNGYTSGNTFYLDWTATKKFDKWEVGPVGFFKVQTTDDTPGGINPASGSAWTCAQLVASKTLPTCGKDINIGAGLLVGYNFGPVDFKVIYSNSFYSRDAVGSPTGSTLFFKTSFRIWAPDEPEKKKPLFAKN